MSNMEKCAELFEVLCNEFHPKQEKIGKKVVQKMFYFFERSGIEINLRYGIHFYGPYSSKLDDMMHMLESEDYISIDDSGTTHIISLGAEKIRSKELSIAEKEMAERVIQSFQQKSPQELEALATMDFIANSILDKNANRETVISRFRKIKGTKFSKDIIDRTYDELVSLKYIQA